MQGDLIKLFGNEKNFQLIKSLMENTPTIKKKETRLLSSAGVPPHISSHPSGGQGATNDKEVKVEKAILDLNELKSQMHTEQHKSSHKKKEPFRETAYS